VLVVFEGDVGWSNRRTGIGKLATLCVCVRSSCEIFGRRGAEGPSEHEETRGDNLR